MKEETDVLFPNQDVSAAVLKYCKDHSVALPEHLYKHAALTNEQLADKSEMMVSPLQAQYLIWHAKTLGAKKILEIGCFTGFSALAFAEALKGVEGAKIVTTDIDPETCEVARKAFKDYGVDGLVTLIEGPALESLDKLAADSAGPFDLAFVDADKEGYVNYFNKIMDLKLLRKGGILIGDNVLRKGLVAEIEKNPAKEDKVAVTRVAPLQAFNKVVAEDPRVETLILPVFDGLVLARVL
ncbi:hypothetical protein DRE_00325 [Drechslerella stenobrocha 248]|uniref:O-methyltransferase n=1 Tax=Drechslerella stenobrocha 248 TaxID=1043628 RepID=W7I4G4_9PEZI|nr:hypothetical protein DRE_00325 [Drechslerella stenobrocha 248]